MQAGVSIDIVPLPSRLRFAVRYAVLHMVLSIGVALISAAVVFGLLYPTPYRNMLGVGPIFILVLAVDIVCGPLLTLLLASPRKARHERWLDFSLIGLIQALALAYGLHSVWVARPVVLAFEVDRLVVATANEIDQTQLLKAPEGLRRLPMWGVLQVGARRATNNAELVEGVERGLAGVTLAAQPGWWLPWSQVRADMAARARPVAELLARRPSDAARVLAAIRDTGMYMENLRYLPLTSSKSLDWIALLDSQMNVVGQAVADGF